MEAAGKHQVLIFVHSRKETAKTGRFLKEEAMKNDTLAKILRDDSASREILQVYSLPLLCLHAFVGYSARRHPVAEELDRYCPLDWYRQLVGSPFWRPEMESEESLRPASEWLPWSAKYARN